MIKPTFKTNENAQIKFKGNIQKIEKPKVYKLNECQWPECDFKFRRAKKYCPTHSYELIRLNRIKTEKRWRLKKKGLL